MAVSVSGLRDSRLVEFQREAVSPWVGTGKRGLDIAASAIGLLVLSPLLLLLIVLVRLTSRGPVLFRQERIGRHFRPFQIYKFRTMVPQGGGRLITVGQDPRITLVGRLLRRTKMDELPQLFNVLRGDMSLVGPRPESRRYVEMFRGEYEEVLKVRPGVTDWASLKYRKEADILAETTDPEAAYTQSLLPDKLRLARYYIGHASLRMDLTLILRTVLPVFTFHEPQ